MTRTILALFLLLAGAAAAGAQTPPYPAPAYPAIQGKLYKFEKVGEGVYYATGGVGGNIPVIVRDNDVVLVDDGTTPATTRALLADLKLVTDKPVRTVVNTHFHFDHTDGNSVFGPEVQIIAHEFVREMIANGDVLHQDPYLTSQGNRAPALVESLKVQVSRESDPAKKRDLQKQLGEAQLFWEQLQEVKLTPPNVTYKSAMTLFQGGREIELIFLGRGHTGGDTVVYLPRERIVCTGDLMESQVAYMGDAFFTEWVADLEQLKKMDFDLVLPGHGRPFSDKGLITGFQGYLTDLMAQVTELRKQGVTADDAAKRVNLTAYQKYFPQITGPGAEVRGVRRMYAWMDERSR